MFSKNRAYSSRKYRFDLICNVRLVFMHKESNTFAGVVNVEGYFFEKFRRLNIYHSVILRLETTLLKENIPQTSPLKFDDKNKPFVAGGFCPKTTWIREEIFVLISEIGGVKRDFHSWPEDNERALLQQPEFDSFRHQNIFGYWSLHLLQPYRNSIYIIFTGLFFIEADVALSQKKK